MPLFKSIGIGRFCNIPFAPEEVGSLVGEAVISDNFKLEQVRNHPFYGKKIFEVGEHDPLPVNDPDSGFFPKKEEEADPYNDYNWLKARAIELEIEGMPARPKKDWLQSEIQKAEKGTAGK